MNYNEILLIKYANQDYEVVAVDIIGMAKGSSYMVARVNSFIEAHNWALEQNAPIRIIEDDIEMNGSEPVLDLFESELYIQIAS